MQERIAQLVDSSGGMPRDLLQRFKIREVPFYYTFNQHSQYRENIDFNTVDFYRHMQDNPREIPKTSAPNVGDWLKCLEELYEGGYRNFVVTTISERLSASFQNARAASQIFLGNKPDARVEVFNSNSCACGQAALEIRIGQLIHDNRLDWDQLVQRVKKMLPSVTTLFTVDSFTYMKAGGRIGGATALLGKLVNIKPVCEFVNGVVHPIKAVRGRRKSLQALVDVLVSRIKEQDSPVVICMQNAICEDDESFMLKYLRSRLDKVGEVQRSILGTAIGAHSGPGAIGIGYVIDRE
ncbi:DegV family protein [Syntrophomonas erecta]